MTAYLPAAESPDRLIYAHEAAARLRVDVATVQRWHARHSGPPVAVTNTGTIAYWRAALEERQNQLGGRLESTVHETLVRLLPDDCYVVRVAWAGTTGERIRFELRRGRQVIWRFACLADARRHSRIRP